MDPAVDHGGVPPAPAPRSSWRSIPSEAFGQAARGMVVWVLLAFALVVWLRFTVGRGWLAEYLTQNTLPMHDRIVFIVQILAAGVVAVLAGGTFLFVRRHIEGAARSFERWAWFLSPLILLPAVPGVLQTKAWFENHNGLLPIALFGGLLAEFFIFQSLCNVPAPVRLLLASSTVAPTKSSTATPTEISTAAPTEQSSNAASPTDRRKVLLAWFREHALLLFVVGCALAYGIFMSFYTIRWHHRLGTAIFDLGINNNLFAGGLHGKFNQSPIIFPEDPAKYVANHVKIGLYLFLPIYALFPKPETLLTIQSLSLGLGAIPLFLFARRHIPAWSACLIALAYLAYYPMHGANFYEMKEPPTAAAFVLTTIWAMDSKRFKTGWVFFFFSMIMREDMPIPLAVIGMFLLLSAYRPRTGLAMTAIATAWFIVIRFKVMTDAGSWWFPNMYQDLYSVPDKGFRSVLKTLISNPAFVLKHIFVEKKFWYIMHLMVPVLFLPARRWYLWAAFIPGAILTLLITDYDPPLMFSFQYVMYWGPYLFVAAVLALKAIRSEHPAGAAKSSAAVVALALVSAALSFNYGAFSRRDRALQSGYHKITFSWGAEEEKRYRDVLALVASIPKDASVAATERVGAHLSGRVWFYTLRRGTHGAEYVVARKSELRLDKTKESVQDALVSKSYGVVGRFGEFAVLKKGSDPKDNEALLSEWKLSKRSKSRAKKPPTPDPEQQAPEEGPESESGATP